MASFMRQYTIKHSPRSIGFSYDISMLFLLLQIDEVGCDYGPIDDYPSKLASFLSRRSALYRWMASAFHVS